MKTVSEQILDTIEEVSGGAWFKKNSSLLQERIETILAASAAEGTQLVKTEPSDDTELRAVQAQLAEAISAKTTLNDEYQVVYKALVDLATLVIGGSEKLREHVPLTVEKLQHIIEEALTKQRTGDAGTDLLAWARSQQKHLIQIGHGPLASGRYEGAKDILTQLIAKLTRG